MHSLLQFKDVMHLIYMATESCPRSFTSQEIKLLKYYLDIAIPDEWFSALMVMLEAYHLNEEDTDIRDAAGEEHLEKGNFQTSEAGGDEKSELIQVMKQLESDVFQPETLGRRFMTAAYHSAIISS